MWDFLWDLLAFQHRVTDDSQMDEQHFQTQMNFA